jgi:transposase InsO family protein
MDASFCVDCLEEALRAYGKPDIFNSDQGAQFTRGTCKIQIWRSQESGRCSNFEHFLKIQRILVANPSNPLV